MTVSRYYMLFWSLGYLLLWSLALSESWAGGLWQILLLALVSLMLIPVAISTLLGKGLLFDRKNPLKAKRLYRTVSPQTTPSLARRSPSRQLKKKSTGIPKLPETKPIHDDLSHGQAKLSCAIIRAFMMHPYYRTYRILYQPPVNNEPAGITFRRRMIAEKDNQYYQDKALAHLVSCQLEKKLGFMSGPHTREMEHQAYQACRQTAMKLDPRNVNSTSESMYLEKVRQARQLSEYLYPSLLSLIHRITPSQRHANMSLSESEILHWFEYLDHQIKDTEL